MKINTIAALFFTELLTLSCSGFKSVGTNEFANLISQPDQVKLIDVRSEEEFSQKHIPGAINIDVNGDAFVQDVEKAVSKDNPVAVYCRSGKRSAYAAKLLVEAGYTVTDLKGGIVKWIENGGRVVDKNDYIVFDGDTAPDFTAKLYGGGEVKLSELKGKVVMLQFTASWCSICRGEMPFIESDIWNKYKDNPDFVLLAIDLDEGDEQIASMIEGTGITYSVAYDPEGKIFDLYSDHEAGVTRNVLIDREGKIALRTRKFVKEEFETLVGKIGELITPADAFYTLSNGKGLEVKFTNVGARIVSIFLNDRKGVKRDVVLGFDNVEDYYPQNNKSDFGASIGRYANRIADGKFELDGKVYDLPKNNNGHCLHGGPGGWQYASYSMIEKGDRHIKFRVYSPDGDSGFPGYVVADVTYTLTDDNKIEITYEATTTAPTVINMTNHSYFNLSGDPANHSIEDDILYINASATTPANETLIPTGEFADVQGTPFDFRKAHRIGDRINDTDNEQIANGLGYDHNWVLDTKQSLEEVAATVYCQETGIKLTVYTDEPGLQIYTGNFLDGKAVGKGGVPYQYRRAICLESQHYPDTPNNPSWPSAVLRPGQTYRSHCTYGFSIEK